MIELGAIVSFLGGSAFRLIWEQLSAWLQKRQQHKQELELMKLQAELEASRFARQQEAIRLQADLQVKVIEAQRDHDVASAEASAWARAVEAANKPSGIWLVDLWNGCIRPAAATIALAMWVSKLQTQGWVMNQWDMELMGIILGFFFATRIVATGR